MVQIHPRVRTARTTDNRPGLAFEEFFEAERRRLFRALFVITGSAAEADELTQDAFLKVWERWDRVRAMENPVGFLFRIGLNASRSRARRAVLGARQALGFGRDDDDPYLAADARDAVIREVRRLTPRQREALVLVDLLDLASVDAGELMGVTDSTVRNLVAQAHAAMRRAMEDGDDDE